MTNNIILNRKELEELSGIISNYWSPTGAVQGFIPIYKYQYNEILVIVLVNDIVTTPFVRDLRDYIEKNRNILTSNLILEKLVKNYFKLIETHDQT